MRIDIPRISVWGISLGQRRWNAIQKELIDYCKKHNIPSPEKMPNLFQYDGWGLVGFPPTIACNVSYWVSHDKLQRIDGYRFTGKGYEE